MGIQAVVNHVSTEGLLPVEAKAIEIDPHNFKNGMSLPSFRL